MIETWEVEWYDGKVWRGQKYDDPTDAETCYQILVGEHHSKWKRIQLVHTTRSGGRPADVYHMIIRKWTHSSTPINVRVSS